MVWWKTIPFSEYPCFKATLPFSTLNPKLLKTLKEITRSLKLRSLLFQQAWLRLPHRASPTAWLPQGRAVCWKSGPWALQGGAVGLLTINWEQDLLFPKVINVCSCVQRKPTVLQDDMWTSTTFQSPITCEQNRSPCLPRMGSSSPEIPWSRTPVSTHPNATHEVDFTEGRKSVYTKWESTEVTPSEVCHLLGGAKSHTNH